MRRSFMVLTLMVVLLMALGISVAHAAVPSPSVTITTPAGGATVSGNVAISATCASGGVSYTITKVYYQIGSTGAPKIDMSGTLGGTSGTFTATWDSTTVANGSKKIYVGCTNSGNKTTTKNITVTVSNSAAPTPTVGITSPANGATVSGTAVGISATCNSGGTGYTITGATYSIDNGAPVNMSGPNGSASGTWTGTWNSTQVANGSHTITVTTTNSGNKTGSSTITVTVSNAAPGGPTVGITAPAAGSTVQGWVVINATCTAPSGKTITGATYQIDSGATLSMTGPAGADTGTWTNWWDSTRVTNASHTIKVTATDSSGSTGSSQITVSVSNPTAVPPTVIVKAPANASTVSGSNVSVIADCTGGGGYTVTDVSFKIGSSGTPEVMAGPDGTGAGTWNGLWDTLRVANGTYTLYVTVTNSASQTATASVSVTVNNSSTALSIQAVTNRYKYKGANVVTVKALTKRGLYRLTSSRISTAKVTIKNPSGSTIVNAQNMTKEATGLCVYNYTLPATPAKGKWTFTVTITSTYGSTGTGSGEFMVQLPVPNHSSYFTAFEGTKTCITSSCHAAQANSMFSSLHYQWRGDNSKAIELAGSNPGISKMGGINNYCGWAENNWIGTMTNLDDTKNIKCGCAWCHTGLGLKPTTVSSTQQLENIDCLLCHSPTYKRIVQTNPDGTFVMVPDPTIDIQAAAKNIARPSKATCLNCHKNSGGGDNNKRGDIDSTLATCTSSYDVHLGTNGQIFDCQDCHKTVGHKIAGRGTDMRVTDLNFDMSCESCHTQIPHRTTNTNYSSLQRHTDRLNCTTCHVPKFAKAVSTDMYRDWSRVDPNSEANRYDPFITRGQNVRPAYAWFNTFSHFYKFKDPVTYAANGKVKVAYPEGDYVDIAGKPLAKLYPYKIHICNWPKNNAAGNAYDNMLLPLKNKVVFETGNIAMALTEGSNYANVTYNGHTFVETESYQSIHHTVGPKSTALASCSSTNPDLGCHGNQTRIPFTQLGYQRRGTDTQLCDVCHSMESRPSFTSLHGEHRDEANCGTCHGTGYPLKEPKTTLCDNCHSMKSFSTADYVHSRHRSRDCSGCHTFTRSLDGGGHSEYHDD